MSERTQNLLIVDDERDYANGLARLAARALPDIAIRTVYSGGDALRLLGPETSVVLLDLTMPGMQGLEVLKEIRSRQCDAGVIILTAHGTVETAVSSLKQGAIDFLTKPVASEDLIRSVTKALEYNRLKTENTRLRKLVRQNVTGPIIVGDSPAVQRMKNTMNAIAGSSYTVLVRGESGTGKESASEYIHRASSRVNGPLVSVNCPAIPENLLESELFGHARGAFTGADKAHDGLFVQASGGTLLLDEIGDIPLLMQTKLLRVLQDNTVRPVGSSAARQVDVRIIAVTNQNLEDKISRGLFREDLYYRLNVLTLHVPPLRERQGDIPLLASYFLQKTCVELGIEPKSFTLEALTGLSQKDWPGNLRELQNFVRRMTIFCPDTVITRASLFAERSFGGAGNAPEGLYKDEKKRVLDAFTLDYFHSILRRTGGNISLAANLSGIERVSLQKILRRLKFDVAEYKATKNMRAPSP